ncbi:MAG: TatD family hydrolase [Phycisphaeraceae bacterium]|nr:TatD family hydrolase [Phycisphaeraceae bacterium]
MLCPPEGVRPLIDTHCHLTNGPLRADADRVIDAAVAAGVDRVITVAVGSDDAEACLAIAERRPEVWCSAGVHPLHSAEPVDWATILRVARHPRCVAFGELGLDGHYPEPPQDTQARVLEAHLQLIVAAAAEGVRKPVIVHSRNRITELLARFESIDIDPSRFVFHCFTGTPDEADRIIAFGAMISFTGVVTYRSGRDAAEAARRIPLERLMVETDAPYLTPEPDRGHWPNEPARVVHTARFIAAARGMELPAFEAATDRNAVRFFGLPAAAGTPRP